MKKESTPSRQMAALIPPDVFSGVILEFADFDTLYTYRFSSAFAYRLYQAAIGRRVDCIDQFLVALIHDDIELSALLVKGMTAEGSLESYRELREVLNLIFNSCSLEPAAPTRIFTWILQHRDDLSNDELGQRFAVDLQSVQRWAADPIVGNLLRAAISPIQQRRLQSEQAHRGEHSDPHRSSDS